LALAIYYRSWLTTVDFSADFALKLPVLSIWRNSGRCSDQRGRQLRGCDASFSRPVGDLVGSDAASLVLPPKLQLLSGYAEEKSLAIWGKPNTDTGGELVEGLGYRDFTLSFPTQNIDFVNSPPV
jgi:hypothetical protein